MTNQTPTPPDLDIARGAVRMILAGFEPASITRAVYESAVEHLRIYPVMRSVLRSLIGPDTDPDLIDYVQRVSAGEENIKPTPRLLARTLRDTLITLGGVPASLRGPLAAVEAGTEEPGTAQEVCTLAAEIIEQRYADEPPEAS